MTTNKHKDMKRKFWSPEEVEKVFAIYEKYKVKEDMIDISQIQRSEIPENRSLWAVKSYLYKEYGVRCKGAGVATNRLQETLPKPKTKPTFKPVPKPKAKLTSRPVISSTKVKTTRRTFLWGAFTIESIEA